ncbi:MAG: pseudouridine synthase [Magnetovibrio sp.]|nr:pseudouridine synthase [Magnetovibrio sp.]|tara:strand:- start:806 stop:1645 length:840 start_codon:yes stop_codon:yes gene_type:complete
MNAQKPERVAKVIARAGICSRREAERRIADNRVIVDGKTLFSPATTVCDSNVILVDGKPLPRAQETRLWRYHKPTGLVTSHSDPQGRQTVFDNLSPKLGRVISIGRLDLNSEGLLLLTNDGELARRLEMPSTGWIRRYRVRVRGTVNQNKLKTLQNGPIVAGINYKSIKATLDSETRTNAWLTVALTEGKNREIRKIMEHLDLEVNRLIRLSYGPFELGKLKRSQVDEVHNEILKNQLIKNRHRISEKFRGAGWAKAKKSIKQIRYKKKFDRHSDNTKK